MNRLGIYFGPQGISIVETKLKQPLNNIYIPKSEISPAELSEEKVPEEIKIITLLKNELIRLGIESKEATLILPGKDLIIRTFEMPILSQEELLSAVNFEAKKYLPFKIEELFSDCQWKLDKAAKKNLVLFVGIKKETLDRYLSILDEIGLKAKSIEYSAFSILRIAKLAGIELEDIDLIIPHQANIRIIDHVGKKLKISPEKFFINLQKYGNTSAASIPIAIDEAYREGRLKKDDLIATIGVGAGLTYGSNIIKWEV